VEFKKIKLLAVSLVLIAVSGCASFEKEQLARVTDLPDTSQYQNKPSVFVDLTFYHGLPEQSPVEVSKAREIVLPGVKKAFENTNFFSHYTFDPSAKTEQDYTIKIKVYNHANQGPAAISGFISGFTFGIIPGTATDNYLMELEAVDKQGSTLSKHSNSDAIQTWIGIWFIPMMGYTPEKALVSTLENQVTTALKELVENDKIKYSFHRRLSTEQFALNQ
jgi:hypothetical protein